jgi:type IV pilus assembly protein PilB
MASKDQGFSPETPGDPEAKDNPENSEIGGSAGQAISDYRTRANLQKFKNQLLERFSVPEEARSKIRKATIADLYGLAEAMNMKQKDFALLIAEFAHLPHASAADFEDVKTDVLSQAFCRWNTVAPVLDDKGQLVFLISNPFNWELVDSIRKRLSSEQPLRLVVSEPSGILALIDDLPEKRAKKLKKAAWDQATAAPTEEGAEEDLPLMAGIIKESDAITAAEIEKSPIVYISNDILYTGIMERASDIHIEPKERETIVRYRIDGDLRDMFNLKKQTGVMVISRLKALAGLDIAERLKPQDGAVEVMYKKRTFKLRLATTSTPSGQSLIIRLLEPLATPKHLRELGMTDSQFATMMDLAGHRYGLILVVGPTGSGKTTTIYSFLSYVDTKARSLISVEDPVEYRIPNANQQQVNDKAGVTFEALLKSSVRQDPDILYLGEIRDSFSARMSVDFASTGHMTISTLHTNNATTAIFRLERLGVTREVMAEALLGIVAQRLLKKLCPVCKRVAPITNDEAELLRPFTDELPTHVAHPVGCPECREGYAGREGIYEIISFDAELLNRVREGMSIAELRQFIQRRGGYLISNHAVEKIRNLTFSVRDVYEKVLVEEIPAMPKEEEIKTDKQAPVEQPRGTASILVVEDDQDNQLLISRILQQAGYDVSVAGDGVDALMLIAKRDFDLILSDINMPNLDGFKFLEIINQKGVKAPLMFLTARLEEEDEVRGLDMGAVDYLKKPIKKDALLTRVRRVLNRKARL